MIIREYTPNDCMSISRLFYDTVHEVNGKDYSKEQLDAWATGDVDLDEWNKSFIAHYSFVAEENGIIIGFGDIDKSGYLDRLYVHKDYQRRGVATALCDKLESAVNAEKICVHSSITAKQFFLKRGYNIIAEQTVIRKGIKLVNYKMEKTMR